MKRAAAILTLALALTGAASASGASGPVFTIVGETPAQPVLPVLPALPSAEVPNAEGSLLLPPGWTVSTLAPRRLSFAELSALWHRAGSTYGIPWQVLASINKIESNFGRNMGPSSAGAVGWMQFMPSTWLRWGTDANGDGVADPWAPEDAIFSAARYLAAAGGRTDIERGVFAYNHADWYVRDVLELAALYGNGGGVLTFTLDRLQVKLDGARKSVSRANRRLVRAVAIERATRRQERTLLARASRAGLLSTRLVLERRAVQAGIRAHAAGEAVAERRALLQDAKTALDAARAGAAPASFSSQTSSLFAAASYSGGYVFPVGGGPSVISVGEFHHDYPAADIAAPMGAPLYALADGIVEDAWPLGSGNCGIGFVLATADGRTWTYCHMSFLEPTVQPGVALSAGAAVGLVGSTGHSTGPHLHLQTGPNLTYPQQEEWFRSFAGTAFTWQGTVETQPRPVAPLVAAPVFRVVAEPVFEVVEAAEPDDVVEFSLSS
ncbi:MAG TPA: lytic murein transglycosylase [Gaiellaceae bacterium]|jgi:murein DD-endopeptidase MepM/ murein hydrolase activator NlpD